MRNIFKPLLFIFSVLSLSVLAAGEQVENDTNVKAQAPLVDYQTAKQYVIDNIFVHGAEYMDYNIVVATSGLVKGDTITVPGRQISQAINNLWSQRYYADVRVETTPKTEQKLDIDIYLTERPRIFTWNFEGAKRSEREDITEELGLKRGTSELSDYVLNNTLNKIKKYYSAKGFLNAEVSYRVEDTPYMVNSVDVTFEINKKDKVKVGEIVFIGKDAMSNAKAKSSMKKTRTKNWQFWKSTKFDEAAYENDKNNLIDAYNEIGYRNAHIVRDSIYQLEEENRIGIVITLDEGNKYYFRNIDWVGNSKYDTQMLNDFLAIDKGQTYDKKTLHKRLGIGAEGDPEQMSITSMYQNDGHLFFQVHPAEEIIGADSIDLTLQIIEGKQATINEVNISGNLRVNEEIIRRDLYVRPGELYNRALLMQTLRQLSQMGHFNPENLQPGIMPISAELVDISLPLEEQPSDKFEISGGWGSGSFIGSIGVELTNLSISEFFKKRSWRPYPQGQGQQLSISAQSNGSYYSAFSLGVTEPWVGGRKPNSLTVSAHYSQETDAYYAWESGSSHFRTIGASVGLGRRLSWPDRYFTLYNELSYTAYNLKDWDYFIIDNGTSNIIALNTVLGRSTVDQAIYPRSGSEFSVSLSLTPPYSLFDGLDYDDEDLSDNDRYRWVEYHKWTAKGQWYTPISRNNKLVLMAKFEMGYLGYYNKNKLSPFEGFDVGGDGMSGYSIYGVDVVGLRGYEDGGLTPYTSNGDYARAYNKYTLEVRYPIMFETSSTIYGLIFAEAGNAFSSWQEFDPFLLKRSVGIGIRVYLPILGMVGADWGYGFDKADSSTSKSGGQFHFLIGSSF